MKTMYELFMHYEDFECENAEIRKIKCPEDTVSGEMTFEMSGSHDEDVAFAYDTLEELFDALPDEGSVNLRHPGTGIKVIAINDVPVEPMELFLAWTQEELAAIEELADDYGVTFGEEQLER